MLKTADLAFRIRFAGEGGRLPSYRGSTLRGAFGYVLKDVVCHVHHRDCPRCILQSRCAYPCLFEGLAPDGRTFMRKYPYVPQPFVLRVNTEEPRQIAPGDVYEYGIRLFGPAVEFAPYVVFAVLEMGQRGLGRDRIPFDVLAVHDGHQELYLRERGGDLRLPKVREVTLAESEHADSPARVTLRFATPSRLRTEGRLNRLPDLSAVLRAALRRLRVLSHFYGTGELIPADTADLFGSAEAAQLLQSTLRWHRIPRFSTRQNQEIVMDGVVGEASWEIRGTAMICPVHHWCFDEGLFSVSPDYRITVSPTLDPGRETEDRLLDLNGQPIRLPGDERYRPAGEALEWHQKNRLLSA